MSLRANIGLTFLSRVKVVSPFVKLQESGISVHNLLKIQEIGDHITLPLTNTSFFPFFSFLFDHALSVQLTPSFTRAPTIGGRIKAEIVPGVLVMPMRIPA